MIKRLSWLIAFTLLTLAGCAPPNLDTHALDLAVSQTLTAYPKTITPAITPSSPPTILSPSTSPTAPQQSEWVSYVHEKSVDYFAGFTLHYPPTWQLVVERLVLTEDEHPTTLTLSKTEYEIRILQGPVDAASCLFPGDPDREGMVARYGEYKQFEKAQGILWRRAAPENGYPDAWGQVVCEKTPDRDEFVGLTSVGILSLRGPQPDAQILEEFDQILEQIDFLP